MKDMLYALPLSVLSAVLAGFLWASLLGWLWGKYNRPYLAFWVTFPIAIAAALALSAFLVQINE